MLENLSKSAKNAMAEVFNQLDEILKLVPEKHSKAFSQFSYSDPENIGGSSIKGTIFEVKDGPKISYNEWSFICAYKEVFKASMQDGIPLKLISIISNKQDGNVWKKNTKVQTVKEHNDLESALSIIDKEMKVLMQEEIIKRKKNWKGGGFYALPKNDFRVNTYDDELLIEEPTQNMLDLKRKAIDIYNSFNFELVSLSWDISHNSPPDDFYRMAYYI